MATIGPFTRAILQGMWEKLFDPSPGNQIFLPNIIRNGYPQWGLPSYDPANITGTSQPLPILGVDPGTISQACTDDQSPIPPKAVGNPTINLLDVKMINLSNMAPVGPLTFSPSDPVFTLSVTVGSSDKPFELASIGSTGDSPNPAPNYYFQVGCCDPDSQGKCQKNWDVDAKGVFIAKVNAFTISLEIQLNTPNNGPLSITVEKIELSLEPKNLDINFNIQNSPEWVQLLAQIAFNQGVNSDMVKEAIQTFLNAPSTIADIETLINNILAKLPE